MPCKGFTSATEFLAQCDPHDAGCLVLNMVMPDMDGLAMQQALKLRDATTPIIFITDPSPE
jgi:FixJ family two-component response regulator